MSIFYYGLQNSTRIYISIYSQVKPIRVLVLLDPCLVRFVSNPSLHCYWLTRTTYYGPAQLAILRSTHAQPYHAMQDILPSITFALPCFVARPRCLSTGAGPFVLSAQSAYGVSSNDYASIYFQAIGLWSDQSTSL